MGKVRAVSLLKIDAKKQTRDKKYGAFQNTHNNMNLPHKHEPI